MPFLSLNGLTIPDVEGRRRLVSIGQDSRAFSGAYRLGRRAVRREWEFRTGPLSISDADAFRRFISGDGHTFAFDADNYSSRGLGQASGGGVIFSGAKFGSGMRFASSSSGTWAVQLGADWTEFHHRYESSAWSHYIYRSDGKRWNQGALAPLNFGGVTVSGGSITVSGASFSDFDDLVVLPFRVPDSWIGELYAWHSARAWSALPYLTAGGTFAPSEVRVLGEVRDGEFLEFVQAGARVVGERFDFTLREA